MLFGRRIGQSNWQPQCQYSRGAVEQSQNQSLEASSSRRSLQRLWPTVQPLQLAKCRIVIIPRCPTLVETVQNKRKTEAVKYSPFHCSLTDSALRKSTQVTPAPKTSYPFALSATTPLPMYSRQDPVMLLKTAHQ